MALNFPNSPTLGQIYTDATSGFSYEWNGNVWTSYSPSASSQIQLLDDISASFNGSTQIFALTSSGSPVSPASAKSLIVNLGGVIQDSSDDYTVSGSNISFSTPPATGLTFSGISLGPAIPINTIPNGTSTDGSLTVSGNLSVLGVTTTKDVYVTGIVTATSFVGNVTGNATGLSGAPNLNVGVVTATSFVGSLTGSASTASFATTSFGLSGTPNLNVANIVGTALSISGIGTISDLSVKSAVETVSVASTYNLGGGRVVLECDATNGTVFTHNLANGNVGIVSLTNFPVRGNSVSTFTIIFNQLSSTPTGGIGNTTATTGIGTNITLKPSGVSGFTTSARVATASTITLSTTANDIDIVTFAIHYNGSGTGTPGNYRTFATNSGEFRFGTIGF